MKFIKLSTSIFNAQYIKRLIHNEDKIVLINIEGHYLEIPFKNEEEATAAFEQAVRDLTWTPPPSFVSTTDTYI